MISCIILAAGQSIRMGKPKYNLNFSEEETFLDHIIHVYKRIGVAEIVLVVNESFDKESSINDESLQIVINKNLEFGRFYSIQLGLKETKNSFVFIQNIDNPFVNPGLLLNLQDGLEEADFTVPVYEEKGGHPVLLSQKMIEPLTNDFNQDDRFDDVLKFFKRRDVIVNDPYIGVNINTPEDYQKYFSGLLES